jgi:uncharacterized protein
LQRYLENQIKKDLDKKMVFISGPRQVGKTTLALDLLDNKEDRYLNWDTSLGREKIIKKSFPSKKGLLVLDEIHKFSKWRDLLKDLYDSRGKNDLQILVTGSARLDYFRKSGDSLQGRYHHLRLHPLSFRELNQKNKKTLLKLLNLGPFPEPYLNNNENEARRWSREYRLRLINEELTDLERVSDISLLELLSYKLSDSVGSILSINSVREDLGVSHQTTQRWIGIFENLYHIFRIHPFGSKKIKAVKKESKHYFFDWNLIDNPSARLENLLASHLLKWCHYIEDTQGYNMELRFFRDLEQREIDFVILKNNKPIEFIECKSSKRAIDKNLIYLKKKFPDVEATQVCLEDCEDERTGDLQIRQCSIEDYLWDKV